MSTALTPPDGVGGVESNKLLIKIVTELQALRAALTDRLVPPDVLTAPQFAALLQVDERTLRELRNAGDVPRGFMVGRSPRWRRSDIDQWLSGAPPRTNRRRGKDGQ